MRCEHCSVYSVQELIPVTKLRMRIWKFPTCNISYTEIQVIIRKQEWQPRFIIYYRDKRVTDQQFKFYAVEIRDTEGEYTVNKERDRQINTEHLLELSET